MPENTQENIKANEKANQQRIAREKAVQDLEDSLKAIAPLAENLKTLYIGIPKPDSEHSEPLALVKKIAQCAELLANLKSYNS